MSNYSTIELENISCAICCCLGLNIKVKNIIKILPKISKPIGRLEEVGKLKNNSIIYVDYAHTPDALKNVLVSNYYNLKKPNLVFGCGGNRDRKKREKMLSDIGNDIMYHIAALLPEDRHGHYNGNQKIKSYRD